MSGNQLHFYLLVDVVEFRELWLRAAWQILLRASSVDLVHIRWVDR